MDGLILADMGNDWSLAGSIMTFAIPVGLFVIVATILYFVYTRPHAVPGHRDLVPAGHAPAAAAGTPAAPAPAATAEATGTSTAETGVQDAAGGTEGQE